MKIIRGTSLLAAALGLVLLSTDFCRSEEIKAIKFEDFKGEASFEYYHESEKAESSTIDNESRQTIYTETVSLWTKGYIYHPNLFDFRVGLQFGLDQDMEELNSFKDNQNSELLGYNIHLLVEKKRPYGFEYFGLKDQEIVQFDFIPDSLVDVTEHALLWHTDNSILPTSIRLSLTTSDQEGITRREEEEQKISITSRNRIGDFSDTVLHYDFRNFKENVGDTKVQDNDILATNTLILSDNKKLTSSVHFTNENDGTTFDQLTASSNLSWKHSDNLDSFYRVDVVDSTTSFPDSDSVDSLSHFEEAGIHHLLYENLTTVASVHNSSIDSDIFSQEQIGGDVDFAYVRDIPEGSVRAHLGLSFEKDDITSSGGFVPVINESHIMSDIQPVYLDNVLVVPGSIVVTDITGVIIYEEGLDYELRVEGDRTRIIRLFGGQILNGQEVLVDYQYQSEEDLNYTSRSVRFGLGATLFDRFSIDYSFHDITPNILSGNPAEGRVLQETDNRLDLRYYRSWDSGLHYEVDAFLENRDSNVSPIKSVGVSGVIGRPFWTRNTALLTSSFSHSQFSDTDDTTDVFTFSGNWTSYLNSRTSVSFQALYDEISGTVDNQTALEFRLRLEMYIRLLNISLNLSHIDSTDAGQDRVSDSIYFRVTRQF